VEEISTVLEKSESDRVKHSISEKGRRVKTGRKKDRQPPAVKNKKDIKRRRAGPLVFFTWIVKVRTKESKGENDHIAPREQINNGERKAGRALNVLSSERRMATGSTASPTGRRAKNHIKGLAEERIVRQQTEAPSGAKRGKANSARAQGQRVEIGGEVNLNTRSTLVWGGTSKGGRTT